MRDPFDDVQQEEWAAKIAPAKSWTRAQFGVEIDHPCGTLHSFIDGICEDCGDCE